MLHFTIPLTPVSKKNSQEILYKWTTDKFTGARKKTPYISPSAAFKEYQNSALWFVPKGKHIDTPHNVKCLFYMPTQQKCDLTNMLEAIDDIMVTADLFADDNYKIIESHDGSRILFDKDNPRTEVYIEDAFTREAWDYDP